MSRCLPPGACGLWHDLIFLSSRVQHVRGWAGEEFSPSAPAPAPRYAGLCCFCQAPQPKIATVERWSCTHSLYSPGSGHSTLLEANKANRLFKHRLLTHTIYQKCCSHACSLPQKPSPLVRRHSKTRSSFGFALENSTPETYIRTARG